LRQVGKRLNDATALLLQRVVEDADATDAEFTAVTAHSPSHTLYEVASQFLWCHDLFNLAYTDE